MLPDVSRCISRNPGYPRQALGDNRKMRRRRTNGLHAVVEMDGQKMNAYYMRESKPGQPKFRTFVPKDVECRVDAPVSPF